MLQIWNDSRAFSQPSIRVWAGSFPSGRSRFHCVSVIINLRRFETCYRYMIHKAYNLLLLKNTHTLCSGNTNLSSESRHTVLKSRSIVWTVCQSCINYSCHSVRSWKRSSGIWVHVGTTASQSWCTFVCCICDMNPAAPQPKGSWGLVNLEAIWVPWAHHHVLKPGLLSECRSKNSSSRAAFGELCEL